MNISRSGLASVLGLWALAASGLVTTASGQVPDPRNAGPGFLGVGIRDIDADRAKALKLPDEQGVEITHVDANSPAESGGLKVGDVVVQYNGQRIEGMEQFSRMVRETPAGRDVRLNILRNGMAQTVTVKLGLRPPFQVFGRDGFPPEFNFRLPDMPRNFLSWQSAVLGVEAEALDGQLAAYFGVKEGVLVRSVLPGSPAEKSGIKAGDVISKIDDRNIKTPGEISNRLRNVSGKSVAVGLMRDHKEMTLTVMIDSDSQRDRFAPGVGSRRVN